MDVEVKKNGKNAQLKDHEVKELIKQSQMATSRQETSS